MTRNATLTGVTTMTLEKVIILARKHLNGANSRICLTDALQLSEAGDYDAARTRALKSLMYSVGAFHSDYKKASK